MIGLEVAVIDRTLPDITRSARESGGGVTIVDGRRISHSNIADAEPERVLPLFDVTLHVLGAGDRFDIAGRRPHWGDPGGEDRGRAGENGLLPCHSGQPADRRGLSRPEHPFQEEGRPPVP